MKADIQCPICLRAADASSDAFLHPCFHAFCLQVREWSAVTGALLQASLKLFAQHKCTRPTLAGVLRTVRVDAVDADTRLVDSTTLPDVIVPELCRYSYVLPVAGLRTLRSASLALTAGTSCAVREKLDREASCGWRAGDVPAVPRTLRRTPLQLRQRFA